MRKILLLGTIGLLLSGCVVINDSGDESHGRRITNSTLKQFEVGKTTKEWTLAVLGEPTHQETLDSGVEVLRYEHSRRKEQATVVFLLFAGNLDREEKQTAYFEFDNDILTRHWVEEG